MNRMINLTDNAGKALLPEDQMHEPAPGSIALTHGLSGTAWQRHHGDGLWHSTTGLTTTWPGLLTQDRLILVHDAEERVTFGGSR